MSLFLLFDSSARLVSSTENGANHGCVNPLYVFGKKEGEGFEAVDVRPKVLREIRPGVFGVLVGHGHLIRDAKGAGIQLDDLDTIQLRRNRQSVELVVSRMMAQAVDLAGVKSATRELGFTHPLVGEQIKRMEKELADTTGELAVWEGREFRAPIDPVLIDWAGKVVPL